MEGKKNEEKNKKSYFTGQTRDITKQVWNNKHFIIWRGEI